MKQKLVICAILGTLLLPLLIFGCGDKGSGPIATSNLFGYIAHAFDGPIQGVEVRVQQIADYTDSNGHYQLPDVPQGTRTVTCTHPDYNSFTGNVNISGSDKQYDIVLTKTVYYTLYVTNDAGIRWESPDENCGQTTVLGIWYNDSLAFRMRQRCFVGLPTLPANPASSMLESAALRLKVKKIGINAVDYPLTVRRVMSPWFEDEITWNDSPSVSTSLFKTVNPHPEFLDIDVLSIYQNPPNPEYGIRIAFVIDEEEGHQPNTIYYKFWSSEGPETNRPFVALKYTY